MIGDSSSLKKQKLGYEDEKFELFRYHQNHE